MINVGTAAARVMGTDGSPAEGVTMKVCGTDICSEIKQTDANGMADIAANTDFIDARFVYGGGKTHSEFAVFISGDQPSITFPGDIHLITLPDYAQGITMTADAEHDSNGVILTTEPGTVFDHDTLLYMDESQHVWRANAVDPTGFNFPGVANAPANMEVLVGLGPNNTVVCPAAKLTVPNVAGWADGTMVDFWVHGHLTFKHYAPYGEWTKVSDGIVENGVVTTVDGQGIEAGRRVRHLSAVADQRAIMRAPSCARGQSFENGLRGAFDFCRRRARRANHRRAPLR